MQGSQPVRRWTPVKVAVQRSTARSPRDFHIHGGRVQVASVSRLFRWIVGGVSDPSSLTQFTEAVRWNLTSGFGVALSESGRPNGGSEDEESACPGHETSGVRQKITTREQRFTVPARVWTAVPEDRARFS